MSDTPQETRRFSQLKYRLTAFIIVGILAGYFLQPVHKHECGSEPGDVYAAKLRKLFDAQVRYFETQGQQFLGPIKLTPGNPTQFMCDGNEHRGFLADETTWASPQWRALNFTVEERGHFAYEVETTGMGVDAKVTVRALSDVNCDGDLAVYEYLGRVDPENPSKVLGPLIYSKPEKSK